MSGLISGASDYDLMLGFVSILTIIGGIVFFANEYIRSRKQHKY